MTFLIRKKGLVERGAYFLDGRKVYSQGAFLNPGRENAGDVNTFFDSLRFSKPVGFAGFPAKGAGKLLDSLHSSDSLARAIAFAFVDSADFETKDLPGMLYEMLYGNKSDSLDAYNNWYVLNRACSKLLTDKSLALLDSTYRDLPPTLEYRRYNVLAMVASLKTAASFDTLLSLLSYRLPAKGNPYEVFWKLEDTLALTQKIYPGLMLHQGDSLWGPALFPLYNKLIDSGFVAMGAFAPRERDLLHFANEYVNRHGRDSSNDWNFDEMTDFLKRFRDTAVQAFFKAGTELPNHSDVFSSACALLFMGDAVTGKPLQTLAKDDFYRQALYDSLLFYKKINQFPQAFLTQRSLAASNLVRGLSQDDDEDDDAPAGKAGAAFYPGWRVHVQGQKGAVPAV